MHVTTPKNINHNVQRLIKEIPSSGTPVFLKVKEAPNAKIGNCFYNVEKRVQSFGGKVQYGWLVWEDPKHLIEAEFHAIWISPTGKAIDITPQIDGEKTVLFIPDLEIKYENKPIDNIRIPFTPEAFILCRKKAELFALKANFNNGLRKASCPVEVLSETYKNLDHKVKENKLCTCVVKHKKSCGAS